jgi:type VI secretion system protein ImpH
MAISERRDLSSLRHLQALIGVAEAPAELRNSARSLLRYAGLFNQYPRSALGLQQLVQAVLEDDPVEVVPCVEARLPIDPAARCHLGQQNCTLGEDSLLGQQVLDRSGSVDIRVGPLSGLRFHLLLPGRALYQRLEQLVKLYLQTPLRCRLVLRLAANEQHCATLGDGWQRLGLDTWLGDGTAQDEVEFMLTADSGRN